MIVFCRKCEICSQIFTCSGSLLFMCQYRLAVELCGQEDPRIHSLFLIDYVGVSEAVAFWSHGDAMVDGGRSQEGAGEADGRRAVFSCLFIFVFPFNVRKNNRNKATFISPT